MHMPQIALALQAVAIATILASGLAVAQPTPSAAASGTALKAAQNIPDKVIAGRTAAEKAASDRATKRRKEIECLRRARAHRLHFAPRRKFLKQCMAK